MFAISGGIVKCGKALDQDMLGTLALNTLAILGVVVIVAMILERALSVLFEWRLWQNHLKDRGLRTPVALIVAVIIVFNLELNVFYFMFLGLNDGGNNSLDITATRDNTVQLLVSAALIAGGSKGAVLLFQGVLGFGRDAVDQRVAMAKQVRQGQTIDPAGGGLR